jgi:hypothetical protein
MLKTTRFSSYSYLASVIIAVATSLWVYLISDNPIKIILSLVIGFCCGVVVFFVFSDRIFHLKLSKKFLSTEKILIILFLLFLVTSIVSPIDSIYVIDWFSLPMANWFSFVLSLFFALFASGFIIINLLGVYRRVSSSACVVLSVLVSMYFTSVFWFIERVLSLTNGLSFGFFALAQFILVLLYYVKVKCSISYLAEQRKLLNLNVVLPLAAIAGIFVSFIVLQEFVYEPFIRGDSWNYVGISIAISKGGLGTLGDFHALSNPNFFQTFLSAVTGLSGFPPVNSLMMLSLVVAVLLPLAFYVMCFKYTGHTKVSVLSTFIFVVVSGFGWLPFVSQKFGLASLSFSTTNLRGIIEGFAPKVLFDITQPQGVLSEGLKTYGFGLLAVLMLLYLFESNLPTKARVFLIGIIVAFAFQVHVEEAIIFTLAFIPAYLIFAKKEKSFTRCNLVGVGLGLVSALSFNVLFAQILFTDGSFKVGLISVLVLGLFFAFTFLKTATFLSSIKGVLKRNIFLVFLLFCYLLIFSVYVAVLYGYSNMSPDYSSGVVSIGLSFPWYYYPMTLGVVGVLILVGLLMNFQEHKNIAFFLIVIVSVIIFGRLLSLFNVNVFLTGTKEWRILYRVIPIPASVFAGWVLYRIVHLSEDKLKNICFQFRKKSRGFHVHAKVVSTIILLSIIVLGIPSTIIASEYWMVSSNSPYGDFPPDSDDIELANFFSHVPISSRVAVANSNASAVVLIAGGMPDTFRNSMKVTRPETIALLSSDERYLLISKTQGFSPEEFSILGYLPIVFNNSKYLVYELPILQSSSSGSNIGYLAPLQYNNMTIPSFLIISSLNTSYQLINDDIYGKSVLLLPSLPLEPTGQNVLRLNGVNEDVDLGNFNVTSVDFSVSAWFRTSASGLDMSLVNKRQSGFSQAGYRILILQDNRISAEINDGSGTIGVTGGVHNDDLWHNVLAVFGQKYISIYVDGKLEGITETSRKIGAISNDLNLTLGSEAGKSFFFNGSISNVCIYNRSLSENEVNSNSSPFNSYLTRSGLYLWLPITEGAGNLLHDGFNKTNIGLVRGASWGYETVPSDISYGLDGESMMKWVENGGKLVVFGGKGEINKDLGFNDAAGYLAVNSVASDLVSFQFNETISVKSFSYPIDKTAVLGYYQFNGVNVCPFVVEEKFGAGSIIYFYVDPIYNIDTQTQGSIIFDPTFLSVVSRALDNSGVGNFSIINSETIPVNEHWINKYGSYTADNFAARGEISLNSTLSGSYFIATPFLADKLTLNQNGFVTSFENLKIDNVVVEGNAQLDVHSGGLISILDKILLPNYFPFQLSNCSVTIEPVDGALIKLQTDKGLFTIKSNESVKLDSKQASIVIKNPSIYINGKTTLNLKGYSTAEFMGETQFYVAYGDGNYYFFDQMSLPPVQSNYPQEYALPWVEILLSPFNIILISILAFLGFKFRKYIRK